MASSFTRSPKLWNLTKTETVSSFENWKGTILYALSLDTKFTPFLSESFEWKRKTVDANRGFRDKKAEDDSVTTSAIQQVFLLDSFLGMIASYAPVISRNTIVRDCCSLKEIFQKLRAHYGFTINGSSIIDIVSISRTSDESPEDVFQRFQSMIDNCLLSTTDDLEHHGDDISVDESLTPTLENLVVCLWLKTLHPGLPQLVKQRFATQLKMCTIASIREEISSSIEELIAELGTRDSPSPSVFQASSSYNRNQNSRFQQRGYTNRNQNNRFSAQSSSYTNPPRQRNPRQNLSCPICKQAGRRNFQHFLSSCPYLPPDDKKFISRARLIECLELEDNDNDDFQNFPSDMFESLPECQDDSDSFNQQPHNCRNIVHEDGNDNSTPAKIQQVSICSSPFINAFVNNHSVKIILDTGATVNLINERLAKFLHLNVLPSNQTAKQADGVTNLPVIGETRFTLFRNNIVLDFEGLVIKGLESEILAGIPFLKTNDIAVRPSKSEITIGDHRICYNINESIAPPASVSRVYCSQAICQSDVTLFPNEFIDARCNNTHLDSTVVLTPSKESPWVDPQVSHSVEGMIRITNTTLLPISLKQSQCLASVTSLSDAPIPDIPSSNDFTHLSQPASVAIKSSFADVKINPQNLHIDSEWITKFKSLHGKFSHVFNNDLPGYNGKFGVITAFVNVGDSLPPQRKGKIPQYSRSMLSELQDKFDILESMGVFSTPEQASTYAEYVNPSFLVKKPNTENEYRLVTSFGEVAAHNKPTPTLTPSVDETLRRFGGWKYIIKSDLRKAYFQIPLHQDSRKYCAVVTPFKGVRVYTRAAMGMPGSESALDELLARIVGDLIQEGTVLRTADDIYLGSDNIQDLYSTWEKVLCRLCQADLRLSGAKTEVLPSSCTILGWIWSNGTLTASPHHVATLSVCDLPKTVKSLRSYIGAYKVVSRVLKHCSQFLSPLDTLTAGKQSADLVKWSTASIQAFKNSQKHLSNCSPIVLPSPADKLWIVTDASSSKFGIGATLVSSNPDSADPCLSSFFSAKLRSGHDKWLPCEIECLAIATSINHFRPLILESMHRTTILTDSKPVIQAFEKFNRGSFSTSSRMQSFLLAATQNNVDIKHIKGSDNSLADFASRNSVTCSAKNCSVCKFISESTDISVNSVSVSDIINGQVKIPFSNPAAWLQIQLNCPIVQLARKHIQEGTRPLKKLKNIRETKQLIRVCSVSRQGLLIVKGKDSPFHFSNDLTVIPSSYAPGLLTAMHLQLNHPTAHQLKQVFNRQFYTACSDKLIQEVYDNCHQCTSLRRFRTPAIPYSTTAPYTSVGSNYTADIIKRCNQKILVLTEEVTKFTQATLVETEDHKLILQGLKELILPLHPPCSPLATLKLDPAPAMQSLFRIQPLQDMNIMIELGEPKNKNKLATIDKQIQELENEITRNVRSNDKLRKSDLSFAVSSLNSRIRTCGLSSYEQWHRRDQFTKEEINTVDKDLINQQLNTREKANVHKTLPTSSLTFQIGSIVYIVEEKTKHCPRPRYIIDKIEGDWLFIRKLTENQIRVKLYKVHKNRCIKVSVSHKTAIDPAISESSDEDDYIPNRDNNRYQSFHPTPTAVDQLPTTQDSSNDVPEGPTSPAISDGSQPPTPALRRSVRPRKPPDRLGFKPNN